MKPTETTTEPTGTTTGRGRVHYAVAGAAARHTEWRAHRARLPRRNGKATPLTSTEWRVLLAVLSLTASWSRLTDYVHLAAIVDRLGWDPDSRESKRTVGRALRSLREAGLILYRPGSWESKSLVGLHKAPAEVSETVTEEEGVGGDPTPHVGGDPTPHVGGDPTPPTEEPTRGAIPEEPQDHPSAPEGNPRRSLRSTTEADGPDDEQARYWGLNGTADRRVRNPKDPPQTGTSGGFRDDADTLADTPTPQQRPRSTP